MPTGDDLGVKALDDWTLEVTMAGPRAYFPQVVAYTAAVPAPKWKVEEYGDKWALNGNGEPIVSNGPFKVDEWNKGQSIKMSKNEGYWDAENIKLTNVIDPIYPAANEVLLYETDRAISDSTGLSWTPPTSSASWRIPSCPSRSSPYVYPGIWMMLPQVTVAPFDKIEVRTGTEPRDRPRPPRRR